MRFGGESDLTMNCWHKSSKVRREGVEKLITFFRGVDKKEPQLNEV